MYRIKNILVRIHIHVLYFLYKIHIWVRYPHDLAFRRQGWYYKWHSKPYANLSHWLFFIAYKVFVISLTLAFVLSPPYQGLYAATSNWDFNGGANGTGDANIVNPSSTIKLKPDWYYTDYQKRQPLTINATDAVSSGYSVKTDLDLAGMVNSSLLRPDLNDLRIGAYDRTDGRFETVTGAEDTSKTGLDRDVIKGQGLNLNGSSQWIDAGNNSSLDLGTGNFTIEGWIYARGGSGNDFILSKDSGTSNTHIAINVNTTNGKIGGWVGGSSFTGTTNVLNSWAHFALVRSGGNLNLYVNGNSDMTPISNSGNVNTTRNLIIGAYVDSLGNIEQHFNGQIDELRWSNTGFYSSNFILQRTPFVPDSNTKGLWHLDGDAGDSSGQGNNGTLNGGPYYTEGKVVAKGTSGMGKELLSTDSGLIAEWRMNELSGTNVSDSSPNSYTATATSNVTIVDGKLGKARSFPNDNTQNISRASDTGMPSGNGSRTIEAWIKTNDNDTNGGAILRYGGGASNNAVFFYLSDTTPNKYLVINYGGTGYGVQGTKVINDNNWHYVVVTHDGSASRLYVDGVADGTWTSTTNTLLNNYFRIGQSDDTDRSFNGLIDELSIYNRALSQSEIREHYNAKSEVWFKTLSNINAGSNSEASGQHSYYAYYNYASAGSPPENKDNVYLFNDDFPGSSIDVSKWPTRSGTTSVSNGELSIAANPPTESYVSTASNYGTNTEFIAMVRSSATAAYSSAGYGPFSDPSTKWFNNSGTLKFRTYQTVATETTVPDISTSYKELRINRNSTTNAKLYWDNTLQATHTTNLATGNLGVGFYVWSAAHNLYVDWIKVRSYTANEPTISNGTETDKGTSNAYLTPGYWTSNNIGHANLYDWGTLTVTKTTPGASTLTVDVLRASDSAVLATNVASGTDLNTAGVSNAEKSIKLRANLAGGADSPTLSTLSLGYSYETDPPTNPTNLSASAASATSNSLTWTASTDTESGIAGYKIERAPDVSGSPGTFAQIGTSATTSWTDNSTNNPTSPPVANTKYWYRVRAYDNAGNNSNYNDYTSANIYAGVGDGDIWRTSEPSWSQARSDPADGADYTSSQQYLTYEAQPSSGVFHLYRGWFAFDTSPIPDGATIGNATLNFNVYGVAGSPSPSLALVSGTQASTSQLTTSDYQAFGSTELASRITVSANGWSAFTLNSSGLSSISKTSFSKYAVRGSHDIDNSAPAVGSTKYVAIYWNEWTGTSLDPFMTVYYSTPVSARTLANVPTSPTASAASTSSINVSWASGGAQDHYHVKSSLDSYASNIYNSTGTSTPQNGLSANIQYTYRIYGVNADDVESSTYASASKYTKIESPTGGSFGTVTKNSIDLSATGTLSNLATGTSGLYFENTTSATNSGWTQTNSWSNSGLSPNTSYAYQVTSRNAENVANTAVAAGSKYTLPADSNVTADKSTSTWYNSTDVIFTNAAGFGAGGVQYYRYVFDQNPTYLTWTGTETQWATGTLTKTATANGSWYLHVKSYNAENAAGTTADYGPYYYDGSPPTDPSGLTIGSVTTTSVPLSWTASTDSGGSTLAGYKIERAADVGGSPGTFAQIGTSATASWTDNSTNNPTSPPVANTKYWYRVRAHDNAGNNSNYNDYTSTNIYAGAGDGDVYVITGTTFATERARAIGDTVENTNAAQAVASWLQSGLYKFVRSFFPFDTSSIPDTATVDNATLNLRFYNKTGGGEGYYLVATDLTALTATSDFNQSHFGGATPTSGGSVTAANVSNDVIHTAISIVLAVIPINKSGFTYVGMRGQHDFDNSAPTGLDIFNIRYSESIGTSSDPYLTVNYSTPVSARTLANTPASPSASAASTSQINVSWSSGGAQDHYHVKSSFDSYASNIYNSTGTSTPQNGLSANIQYTYRIYGVNADDVESSTYASVSKYTLANTPGAPTVSDATTSSLKVVIDQNSNPSNTAYAIYNNTATQYVQADGTLGAGAVYQTYAAWGGAIGIVNTGLTANTSYTYKVIARNGDNVDTAFSANSTAVSTLDNVPNASTIGTSTALSPTSIRWNFTDNANNETGFKLHDASHNVLVTDANPNLTYIDETGLSPNTQYTRHIHAYNGTGDSTASASSSKYTQANVPGAPTVNTPAAATLKVTINQNSNPAGTGYAIYETATAKYVQADGTLGVSAVWQDYTTWGGVSGITVTGLTANKQYTFQVKARNGDLEETSLSGSTSLYTRPLDAAITSVKSTGTWYNTSNFDFTNANSWGDGGVQYYRYFWTQSFTHIWDNTEPTWSNLNANCPGGICSVVNTTLSLTTTADGNWYLYLKAFNGNDQAQAGTPANYGAFMYDGTAPAITDNQSGDVIWRNSNTGIFNVDFNDSSSNVDYFQTRVCPTLGGCATPLQDWTTQVSNINASSYVTNWPVVASTWSALLDGANYISVKTYDKAGNQTTLQDVFYIRKDTFGPMGDGATVYDGTSSDIAWAPSSTQLSANWNGFSDSTSGIASYEYAIGTTFGGTEVLSWTDNALNTSVIKTGLSLAQGQIYYISVRAIDFANNNSGINSSNGQTVDSVSPATSVTLNPSSPNGQNGWYTSVPTVTLSGTDAVSGVQTTYYSWDSNSGPWTAYSGPLIPQEGNQTLYFYSSDNASNSETVKSQNIKTDSQASSIPQGLSASTVSTSQINLSWNASSDTASGIYRYIVYSSTDNITFNQIVTTSSSSYQDTGLSENTTYYYKIKTQDNAGNQSGFSASASAKTNATSSPPPQDNQESSTDDQSGQQQSLPSTAPTSSPKPKVEVGAPVKPETVVIKGKQGELNIPITVNENLEIKVLAELVKKVQIKVKLASAVEAKAIISDQEFGLQNTSGNTWEGEVTLPEEPGTYAIKVKSKKADGQIVEQQVLTVLIDPSGYVFDKAKKTRIVNAVVLLLEKQGENFNSWDAKKYGQENPQKTNNAGEYGFMVPKGTYIVKAEAPGYKLYISDEVVVKDEPITLNIPLEAESLKKYDQNKTIILISTIGLVILGMIIFRVKKNA